MFDKNDFELSVEKKLRLRMDNDEINHCENIETLRNALIEVNRQNVLYQHLIGITLKNSLVPIRTDYTDIAEKILAEHNESIETKNPD